ncbi:MAG: acyl carrier protein [Planctomycetaceae bacterium]
MKETIRQFLVRNRASQAIHQFSDDESLLLSGLIDSGTMVDMILFLESEFGIRVEDNDVTPENMDSLSDLVAFVVGKQRRKHTAAVC